MKDDIALRIARFAHGEGWDDLTPEQQRDKADWAWRQVFDHEREFSDPYYVIKAGNKVLEQSSNLDRAKQIARDYVDAQHEFIDVNEVIHRTITSFYRDVRVRVLEVGG